jgi:Flp pilus assembly protein TadB
MKRSPVRLSRPLYEGLPWAYVACGLAALTGSYLASYRLVSLVLGLFGLVGLLGGIVVLLRRRDYRKLRADYADPDKLLGDNED